ncbi:hypothetical protein [Noviluteimonas gilva]|uniref:Uncharacterized protein n=1 Tax=Noviluteimonas gilva TaxID=2682097 RepID=A0A7C9HVM3_9GAMM|nr:hypothetical protein [Lysobacter gilvus]MUV14558.1 hypothetical protein [Lysobacter gilvus]
MIFKRGSLTFREWWHAPITPRDRVTGLIIGGAGGFWIGLLGRIALGATPVGFAEVVLWGLGAMICCAILGYAFPKLMSVVLFPISIFGVSS